jgi:hypothetical protein
MNVPVKMAIVIGLAVVLTSANATFFGLSLRNSQKRDQKAPLQATANIKTSKEETIDAAKQGEQLRSDKYKFETRTASKISEANSKGNLVLATHKATNAHFVLALESDITLGDKASDNWTVSQIATDTMWLPGACSSKPSFLLQGRYVFIDDGKTQPTDKYGSYVIYDLKINSYVYFGGDSFTEQQALGERIIDIANENNQLVFYIDPTDHTGVLRNSPTFKHAVGSDEQYIIRRVIDPATLEFKDYKLAYTVPQGIAHYYIEKTYGDDVIRLARDGGTDAYVGKVANNRIELRKQEPQEYLAYRPGQDETDLERHLGEDLTKTLPGLMVNQPYPGSPYSTNFRLTELGSNSTVNFLVAGHRYSGYETPIVYDSGTGTVDPLVNTASLENGSYVPLGVF